MRPAALSDRRGRTSGTVESIGIVHAAARSGRRRRRARRRGVPRRGRTRRDRDDSVARPGADHDGDERDHDTHHDGHHDDRAAASRRTATRVHRDPHNDGRSRPHHNDPDGSSARNHADETEAQAYDEAAHDTQAHPEGGLPAAEADRAH